MPPESERDECNSLEMAAREEAYEAALADAARWREIALALAGGVIDEMEVFCGPGKTRYAFERGPDGAWLAFDTPEAALLAWWNQRHTQPKEPT